METNHKELSSVDYYVLDKDLSRREIEEIYDLLVGNHYRAIVSDISVIEIFRDFPLVKVAMLNYDSIRYNLNEIKDMFLFNHYDIDEVEFIFPKKYMGYSSKFWREIINTCAIDGVRVRPMIDLYEYTDKEIVFLVEFLRRIGINTIGVSTGVKGSKIVDISYLESKKSFFPNKWDLKLLGVSDVSELTDFLDSDTADICGVTTKLSLK